MPFMLTSEYPVGKTTVKLNKVSRNNNLTLHLPLEHKALLTIENFPNSRTTVSKHTRGIET